MASGVVTVLDPSYESLFEDGAVYTEASGVLEVIDRFLASPDAFARQSEAGRKLVEAKFSLETYEAAHDAALRSARIAAYAGAEGGAIAAPSVQSPQLPAARSAAPVR